MNDPCARRRNTRKLVFDLIRQGEKISRAQLARQTGMSFPTVMKVVDEFLAKGLLQELDELEPMDGAGRRGKLLRFTPGAYRAIGVECEGRFAHVGLTDMTGNVLLRETIELGDHPLRCDFGPLGDAIRAMMRQADGTEILGVCIGLPANVDPCSNTIISYMVRGIRQPVPFQDVFPAFCKTLTIPLMLENDVNIACEGEAFLRRSHGLGDDMLYMSLGTGCGGALRMNGYLQRGARFRLGEVGQTLLNPSSGAPTLNAAHTTLESAAGLRALEEKFGVTLQEDACLPEDVAEAIRAYLLPLLSGTIYNLVMTLDLDLCVLSGIIPRLLGPQFCQQLTDTLNAALPVYLPLRIEPAITRDAGIIGAGATVFRQRLNEILER